MRELEGHGGLLNERESWRSLSSAIPSTQLLPVADGPCGNDESRPASSPWRPVFCLLFTGTLTHPAERRDPECVIVPGGQTGPGSSARMGAVPPGGLLRAIGDDKIAGEDEDLG